MAKKHTKAARTSTRGTGEVQPGHPSMSDGQVARGRAQMLAERQTELDDVLDKHDNMVRVMPLSCVGVLRRGSLA